MASITTINASDRVSDSRAVLNTNFSNLNTDKAEISGALTQFVGNGNWKLFYSNGSGDITELALGASGKVLQSNGASSAPTFETPSGGSVGPGTINELAYFDTTSSIASLAVATYPSLTEISYVKGVTSAVQTQINAKAPSTSPTFATSITGSYLTASEILITDGSKNIISAAVATYPSLTELTYLKGVTSAIQTQLNAKANSSGSLTQFVGNTAWRVFYSDASGDIVELALGADGTFLKSNGAAVAPSFATPAGSGDVSKVGTPVNNQVGVWTGDGTLEGDADLTFDTSTNTLATVLITATTVTANLTGNVTGNVSGTAATVTTAAQPSITSLGTLTTLTVDDITINGNTISSAGASSLSITPTAGQAILLDGTISIDAGVVTGATSITSTTFVGALTGNASTATNVAVGGITGLGTNVATALAVNVGSAGAFVVLNGALGTPSSGTVTNLTGTASININGTVGATTPTTATFTTATINTSLLPDANDGAVLGAAGTAFSDLFLAEGAVINWDSGDATITQTGNVLAVAGADFRIATADVGTNADSVPTLSSTSTFTNKTLTSPTLTTPSAFTTGGTITLAENTSIALDPAGSADGKYSGITVAGTAGATLAFGDLIYLDPTDSRWELADANAAAAADGDCRGILGICVLAAAGDASATTVLLQGIVRADTAFPALTIGAQVYVSETAGDVVVTQPTTADVVIRVVGVAVTADELYFNPAYDYIVHV